MISIVEEDKDFEEFIMNGNGCIAVPFEIKEKGGEYTITVYSRFRDVAEEFIRKFENEPFSDKAKLFICQNLEKEMKAAGYVYSPKNSVEIFGYSANKEGLNRSAHLNAKPTLISTNKDFEKYYNNATRDIELDDDDENDVCFAIIENECILSFAGVNDITNDGALDINVETAAEWRKKGYATAVVVSLAEYLLNKGEQVSYSCRCTNTASIKVAEKAGFIKQSVTYSFVCYSD